MYEIELTPEARRHLDRLPTKVRDAAIAMMLHALAETPHQLGKPLVRGLEGLWSSRRGDYRVIYEVDDQALVVTVHRVQHRRDVYRPR